MHVPVLYDQVMAWLAPRAGERYIDGTLGGAGHARGILERSAPTGRLLALDADPTAVARATELLAPFGARAILIQDNFVNLKRRAEEHDFVPVMGVLLDLGISSWQLEDAERGFSFQQEGPLDMRFDPRQPLTAAQVVNEWPQEELADILWRYGEERRSRRIAREIVAHRPVRTTSELAQLVRRASGGSREKIDPATRTFMALRIYVNQELEALEKTLPQAVDVLAPGGRLLVIAFHSLEDRIVKQFFQQESRDCLCPPEIPVCVCGHRASLEILTKKPLRPSVQEIELNPRSRSARLRVAAKLQVTSRVSSSHSGESTS